MRPDWIDRLSSSSAEGDRLRKRVAAGAALAVLVSGLLLAVGLAIAVIVLWVVVGAVAAVGVAAIALGAWRPELRAHSAAWVPRARSHSRSVGSGALRVSRRAGSWIRVGAGEALMLGTAATKRVRARVPAVAGRSVGAAGSRAEGWIASTSRAGTTKARALTEQVKRETSSRLTTDSSARMREALQLNAEGTRLRRRESYDEAVDLHQKALAILRDVGDQRTVALTLNNLALAVSHTDGDRQAIGLFEEAASILHDLGDEEHEGRVIANLGLTHRRHGRREQADNVLQLALTKLTPASREYQTVEAELRRAS
jgi:tetratricopeptide (TPR) repeat protein